ncbi:hypothetical protein RE6C_04208 [Rhodopirellula europaea 6C]|uniref:Uncharacterized protein n=1 Tax=Rhodopirellula europaea 6C TaxID=1263867 RepID=M2AQS2_9BACT|nr:hypothetical protein RE6C_04208 [Rhodopirellula europaea 6C]
MSVLGLVFCDTSREGGRELLATRNVTLGEVSWQVSHDDSRDSVCNHGRRAHRRDENPRPGGACASMKLAAHLLRP